MSRIDKIAGCTPDGKLNMSYDEYFESLMQFEDAGGELSPEESALLGKWESLREASECSDRLAMGIYEDIIRSLGTPRSEIEQHLLDAARDALRSLRNSPDDYVWEHLADL